MLHLLINDIFCIRTLKKNHRLNWILEESEFIGECETLHSNFDIKDFSHGCFSYCL
ncbi:MAG: hypothetical protein CM15mV48_540 [uncultured marine virus]|nr:MAG: hypothetical protein CM15mV48_540 [uncultured marine virus]